MSTPSRRRHPEYRPYPGYNKTRRKRCIIHVTQMGCFRHQKGKVAMIEYFRAAAVASAAFVLCCSPGLPLADSLKAREWKWIDVR